MAKATTNDVIDEQGPSTPTNTKPVIIQGISVELPLRYSEGHACTAAEAAALDQLLRENIRNNKAADVRKLREELDVDPKKGEIPEAQKNLLISRITEYAASYVFTLASVGGGRKPSDPIEVEARKIVRGVISEHLRQKGKKLKDVDPDALNATIAKMAQSEDVRATAKEQVEARSRMAANALENLDIG